MTWTIRLQEAFKLALSMTLVYGLALWMDWDLPKYAALAVALIALGTAGASIQKGAMRMVGTTVGLVVGLLVLALLSQARWLNLACLASWLVVVSYGLQTSRFGYAWYVAGFLPPLVWSTTYGDVDNSFHYAVFRYLETSAGILIYTLVCTLLWPRTAGPELDRLGEELWEGRRKLFGCLRRQLEGGELPAEASKLRTGIAGLMPQVTSVLRAAYTDTRSVREQRPVWEELSASSRALGAAMDHWAECIEDCRRLDRERLLPWLAATLETLEERLARIVELWRARSAVGPIAEGATDEDRALLDFTFPRVERTALAELSHFDRAALLGFVRQLRALDETTRETLRTLRVLAGKDSVADRPARAQPAAEARPSSWDPVRFRTALFPGLSFTVGYLFWIATDPPSGPSVPHMAGLFSLLAVMTSANFLALMPALLGVLWLVVAPIYFFVMPWLDSGAGLLALIFGYTFLYSLIGPVSPGIKMWGLILFVMLTGIGNDQVYSFPGLLDGAWMFVLAIGIVAVVQMPTSPVRPEQVLLASIRRFFHGCARITGELALSRSEDRARAQATRERTYGSMVVAEPARLRAVAKKIDYTLFRGTDPEAVQRLVEATQSIVFRIQELQEARVIVGRRSGESTQQIARLGQQLGQVVEDVFQRWSRFEPADVEQQRARLQDLARNLEAELDTLVSGDGSERLDDETLADLYGVLGCARGLIQALGDTQRALTRIDWDELAEARF